MTDAHYYVIVTLNKIVIVRLVYGMDCIQFGKLPLTTLENMLITGDDHTTSVETNSLS